MEGVFHFKSLLLNITELIHSGTYYWNLTVYYLYVERQQERGVLKHVRKTRNHQLIFLSNFMLFLDASLIIFSLHAR